MPMQVVHSVVVDDCFRALYVADRENSLVLRFSIGTSSDQQINAVDLSHFGPVYAIYHNGALWHSPRSLLEPGF